MHECAFAAYVWLERTRRRERGSVKGTPVTISWHHAGRADPAEPDDVTDEVTDDVTDDVTFGKLGVHDVSLSLRSARTGYMLQATTNGSSN